MRRFRVGKATFSRSLLEDLRCPLMSACTDGELAADHGVSPGYVRELRQEMRRDVLIAEVVALAEEVAKHTREVSTADIVLRAMRRELARVSIAEAAE